MSLKKCLLLFCLFFLSHSLVSKKSLYAQSIPDPTSFFKFELGTDGYLASWKSITDYYYKLDTASDRILVKELGKSTLGNSFLLIIISAPENLAKLDRLAEISRTLADPGGLSETQIEQLISEGKSVVAVSVGLHSSEIAATQMAPLLAYRMATAKNNQTLQILQNSVFLLIGCFNPDGTEMVVDWVNKTRGTKYQGASLPDLYHVYAGHDNNRDSYMLSLKESQLFAKTIYHEWIPQMYLDVHQMGSYGARLYIPPYHDPINPNVDPMNWIEHELVGANMQVALERSGITGVVTGSPFTGWWFPSFHMSTNHRNIVGLLTETANARLAWPLYIHAHQLRPHGRSHVEYEPLQVFPNPWPGGWWRLADMIKQQEISTYALLETAANNRELVLRNMVFKSLRTVKKGKQGPEYAYIIPAKQHDPLTVDKLVTILMKNNIKVDQVKSDFQIDNRTVYANDYIVSLAQPNGALVKSLLAEAHYPDNAVTRRVDGSIRKPYDLANFVLAEHMGVHVFPAGQEITVELDRLTAFPEKSGKINGTGNAGWLLSHKYNNSFLAINELLAEGSNVYWLKQAFKNENNNYAAGAIWIQAGKTDAAQISKIAAETGLNFFALSQSPKGPAFKLKKLRMGMYRRFLRGNKDEGWTRYIFDNWNFPYKRIQVDDIKDNALSKLDVFVIPNDNTKTLMGGTSKKKSGEYEEEEYPEVFLPPEYSKGFDEKSIHKLKQFIRNGGTLVAVGNASAFAIEKLGLPVTNVVQDLPESEYFNPGSNLFAQFDINHPLAYSQPEQSHFFYKSFSAE